MLQGIKLFSQQQKYLDFYFSFLGIILLKINQPSEQLILYNNYSYSFLGYKLTTVTKIPLKIPLMIEAFLKFNPRVKMT